MIRLLSALLAFGFVTAANAQGVPSFSLGAATCRQLYILDASKPGADKKVDTGMCLDTSTHSFIISGGGGGGGGGTAASTTFAPSGDIAATNVQTAIQELDTEKQAALGYIPQNAAQKGVANGYAGLDGTGKVPAAQLPTFATTAGSISFTPSGGIAANNVQGALQELDAEKQVALGFTPMRPSNNLSDLSDTNAARNILGAANNYVAQRSGLMRSNVARDEEDLWQINAGEYCPAPNGSVDSKTCLQNAVTEACNRAPTLGGGSVKIEAGVWRLNSVLVVPCASVRLAGDGVGNLSSNPIGTQIACNVGNSACIYFSSPGNQNYTNGGGISDMTIRNIAGPDVSTTSLQVEYRQGFVLRNVYFWEPKIGIRNIGGRQNLFTSFVMEAVAYDGYAVYLDGPYFGSDINAAQYQRSDAITVSHGHIMAGAAPTDPRHPICVIITNLVQTVALDNLQCLNSSYGLVVSCQSGRPDIGYCSADIQGDKFEVDFFYTRGFQLTDTNWFECRGCYSHAANTGDFNFVWENANYNATWGAVIVGGRHDGARNDCFYIQGGGFRMTASEVTNCNGNNNGSNGVRLVGPRGGSGDTNGHHVFMGNQFCRWRQIVPRAMGSIIGTSDYVTIVGNVVEGCNGGTNVTGTSVQTGFNPGQ